MSEKLGIQNLKEAAIALINTGEKVDVALEDGKVSGMEAINMTISAVPALYNVAKNGKQIVAEFKDLDDDERTDLIETVASELDLRSDYVEKKIEKGFAVAVAIEEFLSLKEADFEGENTED
jgi:hypothetical protein